MKLKVKITGPKVHDVGYRYFLMSNAIDLGLKGFQARNRVSETGQEVITLVEGDEDVIEDFKVLVETRTPEQAGISKIAFEDYQGDVMRTGEYAQVCTALQLNKAIPVLIEIRDKQDEIIGGQKELLGGQKELLDGQKELIGGQKEIINGQEKLVDGQRELVNGQKELVGGMNALREDLVDEIQGLREDLITRGDGRLVRIEKDIKTIKSKLGIR
jgi:acylphosphatase